MELNRICFSIDENECTFKNNDIKMKLPLFPPVTNATFCWAMTDFDDAVTKKQEKQMCRAVLINIISSTFC
jgi:hypothetical protein